MEHQDAKQERQLKGVSEDCLSFYDVHAKCGINLVPFADVTAIPRTGDIVSLPGETNEMDEKKNYGGGRYEVVSVEFYYCEDWESDRPTAAKQLGIQINVKKIIASAPLKISRQALEAARKRQSR
jgi:hypothetical protein